MITHLRAAMAITTALVLAACAANTAAVKPQALAANPACLTQTGNLVAGKAAGCSAFGRSYSNDDIRRTGSMTVGEALPLLDPSITVHH